MRAQIPNAITVLRLVLAAGFFVALALFRVPDEGRIWGNVATLLFILGAITDALDGHLARKWNAISTFGRIMDPFCDKVLVLGAFIALAGPRLTVSAWLEEGRLVTQASGVQAWMVVVILARELLVTAIRGVVESMGVEFGSKLLGKAKMILQSIAIPIVLVVTVNLDPAARPWAMWINHAVVWLTLIVTVVSGWPYVAGARPLLKRAAAPTPDR